MILDLFLIGLVVTLEPIPLSAFILLLAAERGLLKGLGFVLGWLGTLVVIVAVIVVVTGGKPLIPHSSPSTAALAVKLAIGAVLIGIGLRRRARLSHRSESDPPPQKKQPRWMARIDQVNPLAAAGLGFLLQPWVLIAAGVTSIVEGKLNTPIEYFLVFFFAVWCSASYLALETYAAIRPEVVKSRLQAILDWINTHTDQAIAILSLALGLYLMGKAIYGLVSSS